VAGQQTHGYDLVIEFAEQAYQELLTIFFDSGGFLLSQILGSLGIHVDPNAGFSVTVSFDRPGGIPSTASDVIDIQVLLGESGSIGSLRIVASVDVVNADSPVTQFDLARINLQDKLWLTEISVLGSPDPGLNGLFAAYLRDTVKMIPLLPVAVDRATTSSVTMKAADVHIIDDTSAADKDASAFLVTFGGGAAGDRNAFTESFISPGGNGGIAVSLAWICRVISPMIDTSLNLGGAFSNCQLTRTVRIDQANEVDLVSLSITPASGFLDVQAGISKSGFCYSATGTVGAKILIEVSGGNLIVRAQVDSPNINIDIPWYCWVVGAVIGALLGGLLAGVIGAIVGGVLVPLITYIAQEVIEGTINAVAQNIVAALNNITPNVDLPAVGFNLVFSDAFIDDVVIACQVQPIDSAPVRCTGTVVMQNGTAIDLDSGQVGPVDMPGADLTWTGSGFNRVMQAVCGARLARTGLTSLDGLPRSTLYDFTYDAPNPIPLDELAQLNPLGWILGDPFVPCLLVYGVRTNEDRWAAVQVVEVTWDLIRLRFITWEKPMASVAITGGFSCAETGFGSFGTLAEAGKAAFVPSAGLAWTATGTPSGASGQGKTAPDPYADLRTALQTMLPALTGGPSDANPQAVSPVPLGERRIGRWWGEFVTATNPAGRFDAVTSGMGSGQTASWQVDGRALRNHDGDVDLGGGVTAHYHLAGTSLVLTLTADRSIEMLLSVTVTDTEGNSASSKRCVRYEPACTGTARFTPAFGEYRSAWLTHFGIVEVPVQEGIGLQ
jgi:hypothetical protein